MFVSLFFQLEGRQPYQYRPPVQSPISPPYEQSVHLKKSKALGKCVEPTSSHGGSELNISQDLSKLDLETCGKEVDGLEEEEVLS